MNQPRMREVYAEYQRGMIPFERVVEAADRILEGGVEAGSSQDTAVGPSAEGHTSPRVSRAADEHDR